MFKSRSLKLERIDTGDYTPQEYERFLSDIRLVNRYAGDSRALRKTLLAEIKKKKFGNVSILDIGAGSGELLRVSERFLRAGNIRSNLVGLELNERSAMAIVRESENFQEIRAVRANALALPFADNSFDYVISSLFTHHLKDESIITALREMSRVARRGLFSIDLHRHAAAYGLYKVFCAAFRISPLVREDGLLSILRGFKPFELTGLANKANLKDHKVERRFPFRLVLSGKK